MNNWTSKGHTNPFFLDSARFPVLFIQLPLEDSSKRTSIDSAQKFDRRFLVNF